jgi:dynein heavy chain 1
MKETSPGLHQKIVAEDKAVESRTRDYLGDWEKNKPVEGRRRPKKAVERFQLFEAKYSSLKEERDKVGKAKEALEPQETGPISTNEERMQVNNNKILVEFFYVCVILIGLVLFFFFL